MAGPSPSQSQLLHQPRVVISITTTPLQIPPRVSRRDTPHTLSLGRLRQESTHRPWEEGTSRRPTPARPGATPPPASRRRSRRTCRASRRSSTGTARSRALALARASSGSRPSGSRSPPRLPDSAAAAITTSSSHTRPWSRTTPRGTRPCQVWWSCLGRFFCSCCLA
jgi:hypothetical protein